MSEEPTKNNESLLSKDTIIMLVIGIMGVLLILTYINYSVGKNLQGVVDNRPPSTSDVRKAVGRDIYDRIEDDVAKLNESSKLETEQQEFINQKLEQERLRVRELEEQEPLKEGHIWRYDIETGGLIQTPVDEINTERYEGDEVNTPDEAQFKKDWDSQELVINHPRDEVILELAKPIEAIDPGKIYLTKGQFVYWLQDNLLYLVGDNSVQTFWDPETFEARVVTLYGNKEYVESVTRKRIELAYTNSSYGLYDADKLSLIYE